MLRFRRSSRRNFEVPHNRISDFDGLQGTATPHRRAPVVQCATPGQPARNLLGRRRRAQVGCRALRCSVLDHLQLIASPATRVKLLLLVTEPLLHARLAPRRSPAALWTGFAPRRHLIGLESRFGVTRRRFCSHPSPAPSRGACSPVRPAAYPLGHEQGGEGGAGRRQRGRGPRSGAAAASGGRAAAPGRGSSSSSSSR